MRVPTAEEALLLEEAWASLIAYAASVQEVLDFTSRIAQTMRDREPGLAHHPPVSEAITALLNQRNALRMSSQGFLLHGADRWLYNGLAWAMGASPGPAHDVIPKEGESEMDWFHYLRTLEENGQLWPAVSDALTALEKEGPS